MLRYMAIGDVTSPKAASALSAALWDIRRNHRIDFVAVNAENAGFIIGPSPEIARRLLESGADVLTGGNHMLQNMALQGMMDSDARVLRPANYPDTAPGSGYTILDGKGYRILVISLLGRVHMDPPLDSPFFAAERILAREEGKYDLAFIDLHAEATGEKTAFATYFDGKVSAVYGTHTHVPTADTTVLPHGTGYVSDLGMCGADGGILGMDTKTVLDRYLSGIPTRFLPADGNYYADAVIFSVDEKTKTALSVERVRLSLPTPAAR